MHAMHKHKIDCHVMCHFGGESSTTATSTAAKLPTNSDSAASYTVQQAALSEQKRRGYASTILTQGNGGLGGGQAKTGAKTLLGG